MQIIGGETFEMPPAKRERIDHAHSAAAAAALDDAVAANGHTGEPSSHSGGGLLFDPNSPDHLPLGAMSGGGLSDSYNDLQSLNVHLGGTGNSSGGAGGALMQVRTSLFSHIAVAGNPHRNNTFARQYFHLCESCHMLLLSSQRDQSALAASALVNFCWCVQPSVPAANGQPWRSLQMGDAHLLQRGCNVKVYRADERWHTGVLENVRCFLLVSV